MSVETMLFGVATGALVVIGYLAIFAVCTLGVVLHDWWQGRKERR